VTARSNLTPSAVVSDGRAHVHLTVPRAGRLSLEMTAIVCAMGAASTSNSLASFLLAGVLGFATIGLAQDHAWRRYG
jgi:hypothetical protein